MHLFRATLIGGALFLIPLVFIGIVLGKAYEYSMKVAGPIGRLLQIESVGGLALVELLAMVLIVVVCLCAGLLARAQFIRHRVDRLDAILIELIPGYSIAKSMVAGMDKEGGAAGALKPVLARFDDYSQIAFEVERLGDTVVIFLPGAPGAWSGSSLVVEAGRITPLDIPPHQVAGLMRVLGRGSAALVTRSG